MSRRRPSSSSRKSPGFDALEPRELLAAVTLAVTSAADSGPGSLRQVILDARLLASTTKPSGFRVIFDIPGTSRQTIFPASPFPALPQATMIDGSTQPGYAGKPLIAIDGSKSGLNAEGLIVSTGSEILDLSVSAFSGDQILMVGEGSVLQGDEIGVNPSGRVSPGPDRAGVSLLGATNSLIGGDRIGQGNVIAGNEWGIFAFGAKSDTVIGNIIGLDPAQTIPLGNTLADILLVSSSGNKIGGLTPGDRNVIAASPYGIELRSAPGASGNKAEEVTGNLIGQSDAAKPFPNSTLDLFFDFNSTNTVVRNNTVAAIAGSTAQADLPRVRDVNNQDIFSGNIGFDSSRHAVDLAVSASGFFISDKGHLLQQFEGAIVVTNHGASTATDVLLELDVTPNASFYVEGYRLSQGSFASPFVQGSQHYYLQLGSIAAGASVTLNLTCQQDYLIPVEIGSLFATVASDGIDPHGADKRISPITGP